MAQRARSAAMPAMLAMLAKSPLLLLVLLLASAVAVGRAAATPAWTQTVARTIDVTSQLVRETATVTLELAAAGGAPVTTYDIVVADPARLASVQAKSRGGTQPLPLAVTKTGADGPEAWRVTLEAPLAAAGDKAVLVVSLVYINKLVPVPARVEMLEPQFVRLDHTVHFYSPYPSAKERTIVTLPPGSTIKGKTEGPAGTVTAEGSKVTYGPYTDVAARDAEELFVHFENNAPFAVVTRLERTLEVSHWGANLAVEEFFDVEHRGAALEGQFSRLDLMRGAGALARSNVITSFTLAVPIAASDIYYRDVIGNISTSTVRPNLGKGVTNLILEPRYPLFGGWKLTWYHGWNEPLSTVLSVRTDQPGYVLKVPLATLFDNAAVEHFTLRVTLPEGAHNIQLHTDVAMDDIRLTTVQTYLDSTGRPVLVATRARFVNDLNGIAYITYELPATALLNEPLLLTGFFLLLFVTGMIYVRIDLTITKDSKAELRDKVDALLIEVLANADSAYGVFDALDAAAESFKDSKDGSVLKAAREKAEARLKRSADAFAKSAAAIHPLDAATAAKVTELARLFDDKLAKVRRLHVELQNVKPGSGKESANASAAARAVEAEIAATSTQIDGLVSSLDK